MALIYDVEVHGYRSLLSAKISLKPGLNVLVGANGSGKTNLINFFDFLTALLTDGVPSAFERAGGAAHAFSMESMRDEEPTLQFTIRGTPQLGVTGVFRGAEEPRVPYTSYEYDCTIKYNKALRVVFVARERVSLLGSGVVPFVVTRETVVSHSDQAASRVDFQTQDVDLYRYLGRIIYPKDDRAAGERLAASVSPHWPLLAHLEHEHQIFAAVSLSLVSLASINVRPEAARRSTSISDLSMLRDDGAGLVSVLYRLKRGQYYPVNRRRFTTSIPQNNQRAIFKSILNWVSEVNPDITDIETSPNNDDATLSADVLMNLDGQQRKFAFRKISDGTVKWLALVTALFAAPAYGAIEEPENFLDPRMQEIFVKLVRDRLISADRVFLVSTHSESLLNLCTPDELLVFRFDRFGTTARRPNNQAELRAVLKSSRFGLGHYYRVGAVDA